MKAGEVVLDPMCGGGSIPLEGCQMDSHAFYLGPGCLQKDMIQAMLYLFFQVIKKNSNGLIR